MAGFYAHICRHVRISLRDIWEHAWNWYACMKCSIKNSHQVLAANNLFQLLEAPLHLIQPTRFSSLSSMK